MIKNVLDHGEVELIDTMGDDRRILRTARVSTGSNSIKGDKKDKGLIRYLYKNNHWSPFESVMFTFRIKCPIFVARQLMRHKWSFNEKSGRYSEMQDEYYTPQNFRLQSEHNKQSSHDNLPSDLNAEYTEELDTVLEDVYQLYDDMLSQNIAREQARIILPLSQYTELYGTVNLRALLHFLYLRMHEHAQEEMREYAWSIYNILKSLDDLQWTMEVFDEFFEYNTLYTECVNVMKPYELNEVLKNALREKLDNKDD